MSAQPLEVRMAHLEGAYEQINERLGSMEVRFDARFDALDRKIELKAEADSVNRRFDAMEKRFDTVDGRFEAVDKKFTTVFMAIWGNTAAIVAAIIAVVLTNHH